MDTKLTAAQVSAAIQSGARVAELHKTAVECGASFYEPGELQSVIVKPVYVMTLEQLRAIVDSQRGSANAVVNGG
jgi:hypothetical protein